jgi:hypothetical protein
VVEPMRLIYTDTTATLHTQLQQVMMVFSDLHLDTYSRRSVRETGAAVGGGWRPIILVVGRVAAATSVLGVTR